MQIHQRLAILFTALYSITSAAVERIELEGTSVRGDQEQPQVLYLIPWQTPKSPEIQVPAPKQELDGILEPVERQSFRERLYYRQYLKIGDLE
ncbi:hypothetical protein BTA51_10875 [Hahella sp. CCB-MM4]|uniref:hypothetical protein n=1 Tax=Hahella sp. (strain CCB-MM4) TaxID=1926491 RepID=UPI000B9AD2DA|nr:hypothetical protein [Hahella sp. CCB-MM4]OZG73511.1 hypothetical protein BTA51_10875 [Hahella sp. CCB-MM4]